METNRIITFPGLASKKLPGEAQTAYYNTHYLHIKNYLSYLGNLTIINKDTGLDADIHNNNFIVKIDHKSIMFDYSDFDYFIVNTNNLPEGIKYFKIHTTANSNPHCLAFPPISFPQWYMYEDLKKRISYNPNGNIFYKCKIYGGAIERREKAMRILKNYKGCRVDFNVVEQHQYFESMNNCRINVIVPGARNDILDRTHMQSFALGIPVITPFISTLLPFNKRFEPNIDYIECSPDYSNLVELLEKYKNDKEHLDFISNNCKMKFEQTCSPAAVKDWILSNID